MRKFLLLLFLLSTVVPAQAIRIKSEPPKEKDYPDVPPVELYDKVWKIIKNDYVDQHYNHQDWEIWRHRYDEYLETRNEAVIAIKTMVASLGDRYTRYLDRKAFEEEKESIEAELTGVGIQIGLDKSGQVIIIAPIEGTPGSKADLRPNDLIIEIDGKNTSGLSIENAAKMIRGPVDTEVTLTIKREDEKLKKTITRAVIPIRSIPDGQAKIIFDDVGYIRLSTFISKDTVEELLDAMDKLNEQAKGFIIDLRNNPGGLLNNAMVISDMFISEGVIVSTVNKNGYVSSFNSRKIISSNKPLVLLVNSNSASASEIFSGAVRDNGRAEIVGTKTFGKGLVQAINKLGDGSGINVTIAKYLTPNKTDINKKGIKPDYEVKLEKLDYDQSRGPWFFDPNVKFGVRQPEDAQDKQLMKGVAVLKNMVGDTAIAITQEILDKVTELDAKYEEEKAKKEAEKDEKKD
ncbi:MAG: S41 family peptidase [Candidatus Melainabacteria bacterium]|nr:S41 family peptidase [Candidatus Melainabacteria bacterium]